MAFSRPQTHSCADRASGATVIIFTCLSVSYTSRRTPACTRQQKFIIPTFLFRKLFIRGARTKGLAFDDETVPWSLLERFTCNPLDLEGIPQLEMAVYIP